MSNEIGKVANFLQLTFPDRVKEVQKFYICIDARNRSYGEKTFRNIYRHLHMTFVYYIKHDIIHKYIIYNILYNLYKNVYI